MTSNDMSTAPPTSTIKDETIKRDEYPAWLDASLVQKAMANNALSASDNEGRVEKLVVSRATAPGDNYCSVIFRMEATLEGSGLVYSLLVKIPPEGKKMTEAAEDGGLFKKEIMMLTKYIPAVEALLGRASHEQNPPLVARCLLHGSFPVPFIVLEDLKPQGFRLAQRDRGLGLRHSLMALRSLARLHAASAALIAQDPSITDALPNPMIVGEKIWTDFVNSTVQMMADACKRWPGFEEYADMFERFLPKAMKLIIKSVDPIPGKFNVIVHGDFWVNNIMFKYEDINLTELRMIDLQLSFVSSPAVDVINFLYSSVSDNVSEKHELLLLREYHVALNETLHQLGQPQVPFEELQAAIDCRGVFALFTLVGALPIVRAEKALDVEAALDWDVSSNTYLFENPSVRSWIQRLLPLFKGRGWLDF